jgi:hypothetical protein
MATTVDALVLRIRHELRDYGVGAFALSSSVNDSVTEIRVTTFPLNAVDGQRAVVGTEDLYIKGAGNPLVVNRGELGSTAAAHSAGDLLIIEPRFTNQQILDALISAQRQLAGYVPYLASPDTTNTTTQDVEEYAAPAGATEIIKVELETYEGSGLYRVAPNHQILEGYSPPKVRILAAPTGLTIRLTYHAAYTEFTWATNDVNAEIEAKYTDFLIEWAKGELLTNEVGYKSRVVAAATGDGASVQQSLVLGQTIKASALGKLRSVKPPSRIIHRSSSRVHRM